MHPFLAIFYLCFIFAIVGCAINRGVSGPEALKADPEQPAQTGTTNADRSSTNSLTNTF